MIKIDFEITHAVYGTYRDAIYLHEDHNLSEEQIEAMKQERYASWLNLIENPPQVEEQEVAIVEEETSSDYVEIDGVKYKKVVE